MFWILSPYNNDNNTIPLHTECKLKLHLNTYLLHNDICKAAASFGIILLSFVYFSEDMPDDGHMAETYSMIMCRWVFDNKYTVV